MTNKQSIRDNDMNGFVQGRLGRIQHQCASSNPFEKGDAKRSSFHSDCVNKLKVCTFKRNSFDDCLNSSIKDLDVKVNKKDESLSEGS